MRIYSLNTLATLFVVFLHFGLSAQFSISGIITDSASKPLPGATIQVKDTYTGTSSNKLGEFIIPNVPIGTTTLMVTFVGFTPQERTINVNSNIVNFNFNLKANAVVMKNDVIITANKANTSSAISYQDLDSTYLAANNTGVDLPIILQNATSVVSTSDAGNGVGYSGMRIRGSDATRVNVTINGIPFNDPESQGTFFVNLPDITTSANDIQIQRGVGSSTNGAGAFGASVNINTMDLEEKAYGKFITGVGSFNTFRNSLLFGTGLTKTGFAFDGRLSKITSDGYIDRATSDLTSYYAKGAYFGKKFSAKFITFGGKENTYQAWYGVPKDSIATNRTFNPYDYENQVDNYSQTHYQLHLNYAINSDIKLSVSGFYVLGKGYYEEYKGTDFNKIIGGSSEDLADYGIEPVTIGDTTITESNIIRRRWLDNSFGGVIFNFTYTKNTVDYILGGGYNAYSGSHFGEVIWAEYASNSQINDTYYDNLGNKTDWNIYGKANWQTTEKLNLNMDLQVRQVVYKVNGVDNDQRLLNVDDQLTFFNPKAGVNYKLNSASSAYFSFAVANHEPNRGDYIDSPSGFTPKHETLYDYEAGYRFGNKKILATANLYYMQYKDQLVLTGAVNDVGGSIRQNVDNSYRAGMELELGYKITKKFQWNINATLSQNKIKSFNQYVDDWYNGGQSVYELENTDIAFSPSVIIGNIFTYQTPLFSDRDNFEISLISKYVGEQYFDNTQNEKRKLDGYFTNDIRLGYTLKQVGLKQINFNFTVRNLFNTLYINNAWAYVFEYNSSDWDPSIGDPYTQKSNQAGGYQMAGYFPQAGVNFMFGLTLDF